MDDTGLVVERLIDSLVATCFMDFLVRGTMRKLPGRCSKIFAKKGVLSGETAARYGSAAKTRT